MSDVLIGGAATLSTTITVGGLATDPSTLQLVVTKPDGTTDTFTLADLTHVSTGKYSYVYVPATAGLYWYVWTSTNPDSASQGSFTVDPTGGQVQPKLPSGYLTVAEFQNMATYLELDDLVRGALAAVNTGELEKVLARASAWCDTALQGPTIGAKTWTEKHRGRVDGYGMLKVRPRHTSGKIDVRQLVSVTYGATPTTMTSLANVSGDWSRDGMIEVPIGNYTGSWSGSLQFFGAPIPGSSTELFVEVQYVSGFPATALKSAVLANANTFDVVDPTGIQAGDVLTIVDPGSPTVATVDDETVTVQSITNATVTPTSTLQFAHAAGCGVSEVPPDLKQAVAFVARSFLGRRGPEKSKTTWGGARISAGADTAAKQVAETDDFIAQAVAILDHYTRMTP